MRSLVRSLLCLVVVLVCAVQAFAQCNVTLVTPDNGETNVSLTPTLQWNAIGGATQYDIFLGPSGSFACASNTPAGSSFGGSTTFNPPPLTAGTTYEWKVRVMNGSCSFAESPCQTFTTATQSCPTIVPSISAPANNSQVNFGNVTLEWTDVPNAQTYEVWLGLDGDNPSPVANTLSSTLTIQVEPGRSVQWWVVAKAPNCSDLTSSPRSFTTNCPTTPPTPQIPPNGETHPANHSITFIWTPTQGATSYDVKISDDGWDSFEVIGENIVGNVFEYVFTSEGDYEWEVRANFDGDCDPLFSERRELVIGANCTGNIPTELIAPASSITARTPVTFQWAARTGAEGYVLMVHRSGDRTPRPLATTTDTHFTSTDLPGGTYQWWVITQYPNCPDAKSDERLLTIESDCPTARATPQSPANGASNVQNPVTFRWSAVQNARAYRILASIDGANPIVLGTTTNTELQAAISGGSVIWSVQVVFNDDCSTTSELSRFTMARIECPSATINLIAPTNATTVNSPVRLAWSAVAGATSYGVWVSVDNSAPLNITRTSNTEATISLPAGEYRWYVDARRGDECRGVVSDEGRFTVARAANCEQNAAPTVVSPLGGTVQSPVTLTWSAVPNAIAYRVWIGRNGAFEDVGFTKSNTLTLPLTVEGNYAWFVQALYEGCPPVNSNRGAFVIISTRVCPTQAPVITAPANNATVSSPVNIAWTTVAGAQKYRVLASKDGSEPVVIGTTEETSLERTLPPGNYAISVEAVVNECPSTFSARTTFTVPRAQNCNTTAPQPVTPVNGATGLTSPVTFVWNPVSGASGYVLVARVNGGSPTALASTTDPTATHEMPPGRIEWWVVKLAAGCDPVESQHFVFEIPRTQTECENRRPILLLPGEHSGGVHSPVFLAWTAVPEATSYDVYARHGDVEPNIIATTTEPKALVTLSEGTYEWFVVAKFAACNPTRSARGEFTVDPPVPCGTPEQPLAQVVGQALSNTRYRVRWTAVPNAAFYEIQESTTPDFANATTFTTDEPFLQFTHEVTGPPVQYLYRVRAISDCSDARGPYSDIVGVFVIAPRTNNASAEIGTEGNVVQTVFLPGGTTPLQFSITTDKPWLTVTPSSGTLPVEGLTVTVTANRNVLALGTNTGTLKITYGGGSARNPQTHAGTVTSIPLSVSLVTPVVPTGKGTPPPDSLIFPVVGHAQGANDSLFESDIRVTNLTAQTKKYQLNLTPSGTNGTTTGSSSTVEIGPNQTLALDDVVASLFGTGTTSSATGMLEVRPLTTTAPATPSFFSSTSAGQTIKDLMTAASSRTYNFTPNGTFGQFIPAIRYADFVGKAAPGLAPTILSLQQVAQSQAYRANFGFAEASGKPAELVVRVYDTASALLATIPVSLQAGEHKQLNGMLATNGINDLANGRVEVEVLNGDGKVTAYVSEVDNRTNDPLLVSAVVKGATTSNRYVVPGVAYISNASANWVTDLRIFNAGAATPATLTFYPQGNPSAAVTREIQLNSGEIEVLDNVLGVLFAQPNGAGGAIAVTTPTLSQLTATARTYNSTSAGTYGQYVPGVTPAESVGVRDRALQILQLEQSSRLRTNIGLSETSGQSARIDVSVIVPDSIVTPVVSIDLQPNEFRQITLGPGGFGLDGVYNARVTVKVVSGNGRVTAYGSTIDAITQDPTYVPAQ
jgi:hypothetical protein